MNEFYNILAKHFSGNSNAVEENQVQEYIKENRLEYNMLKKFWNSTDVVVHNFNTYSAWKKINEKTSKKQGKIISLNRTIKRIAAVAAILILSSIPIYYLTNRVDQSETIVSKNIDLKPSEIKLSDGSKIWLNKNATLTYPSKFIGQSREVNLNGTAFFEITKDQNKPFVITSKNSKVTVLGTSFNINAQLKSTEINVKTGVVEVLSIRTKKKEIITKNQTAIVIEDRLLAYETSNQNYLSWQTGVFQFDNAPLQKVVSDLNTFYNEQLILESPNYDKCKLTAQFNNSKLQDLLEILATTCNLQIEEDNNIYKIK